MLSNKALNRVFVHNPANTLDQETITKLINERNHFIPVWSSYFAKKADARFKISLVCLSCVFSLRKHLFSADSS